MQQWHTPPARYPSRARSRPARGEHPVISVRQWLPRALLWLMCLCASTNAVAATTLLVLSDGAPAYRATAQRISEVIHAARPTLTVRMADVADAAVTPADDATLVVAIGSQAARAMTQGRSPKRLICTLLTRDTFSNLPPTAPGAQRTAVFIDQPPRRQLRLVRAALPDHPRPSIVYGEASRDAAARFADAARLEDMPLVTAEVSDTQQLYGALREVLEDGTVLLAVPDPAVYNNYTIQNVLLTAYREHVPVIGFSPAYVRAGAIAAVFSSPQQIGDQVAQMVLSYIDAPALPPPADPRDFSVSTNPHVARSLDIELPTAEALEEVLKRAEGNTP